MEKEKIFNQEAETKTKSISKQLNSILLIDSKYVRIDTCFIHVDG